MEDRQTSNKIEQIMKSAMTQIKSIIDVNTVIGSPIKTEDGTTIIPITKVIVGFVAGGGEYETNTFKSKKQEANPFAGGSGSGFNIVPVGFLIKEESGYKMIKIDNLIATTSLFEVIAKAINGWSNITNKKEEVKDNEE